MVEGLPLPRDTVGLLEGITTTRAIRQFAPEAVPEDALATMLFCAARAPSGSNRQPFRFVVLRDGTRARRAKELLAANARGGWLGKRAIDGYDRGSGGAGDSPKARVVRVITEFVERFAEVPVVVLVCLARYRAATPYEGASVYPACQNLLLAARGLGYGGVLTMWQTGVETELAEVLGIPDGVAISATVALGRPVGGHGPVRRRPLGELVYEDGWGEAAPWALDPPGTRHTAAGPPVIRMDKE